MPSSPKRAKWSSHSWARLTGAALTFLIILATAGCDGASDNGGTGGDGGGGAGGNGTGGEGGSGSTTVPRAWQGAVLIEQDDTGDAQEPRLAGSRPGNAAVVWLRREGDRHDVWSNTFDTATGWKTAQAIEHRDSEAYTPQVAMSPDGRHAMAVWSQADEGTITNVWVNHHEGAWRSDGTILDLDNGWLAYAPQVVMYRGGAAKVVWIERFRLEHAVWANRFSPAVDPVLERWWGAERIDNPSTTLTDTRELVLVGYGDAGATAAWQEAEELTGDLNFWASRYDTVGLDWETQLPFGNDDSEVTEDLRLATNGSGDLIAVWHQFHGVEHNIWANRYDTAWGWGDPELIEADSAVPPKPEVAMDPGGNAVVVWVHWDESASDQNIMARRYDDLDGWQPAETIDEGFGDAAAPHVAMGPNGNAMAVWRQRSDTIPYTDDIWSSHYDARTGEWAEPELVDTEDGAATAPRVTMDEDGNTIAVWRQWDDTLEHYDIWANRWAPSP